MLFNKFKKSHHFNTLALVLLVNLLLCACSTRYLETVEDVIASSTARKDMLDERLSVFNHNLYWGSIDVASSYVHDDKRHDFHRQNQQRKKAERLVDFEIDSIDFNDDVRMATVQVSVRYFRIPSYIVQTRKEQQTWEYSRVNGGWLYTDSEELTEEG
jgi:hypothetical protein